MGRHNKFGTGGTGKHFKTIVKEERLLTQARLQGEFDFEKKKVKGYLNMDFVTLLKSASGHLGKMIDRATVDDLVCLGAGFLGYQAVNDIRGGLAGMVAYKLATTDGVVSQAAGLVTLTALGLVSISNSPLPQIAEDAYKERVRASLPQVTTFADRESASKYINEVTFQYINWKLGYFWYLGKSLEEFVDWAGIRATFDQAVLTLKEGASGGGAR